MTTDEINRRFDLHRPADQEVADKCAKVRAAVKNAAFAASVLCPEGRERSLSITHLETALFFAIGSLVRPPAGV